MYKYIYVRALSFTTALCPAFSAYKRKTMIISSPASW